MWKCTHCGETVDETFEICWNCTNPRELEADRCDEPSEGEADPAGLPSMASQPGGMSRGEIAAVICKTLALITFAQGVYLVSIAGTFVISRIAWFPFRGSCDWRGIEATLLLAVPTLVIFVVGIVFWQQADAIARRMVSADPSPVASLPVTMADVMTIAFSTAGLFVFVQSFRELAAIAFQIHTNYFVNENFWSLPHTWSALAGVAIGLWLILGSRGIVGAIHWCRTAGTPELRDEKQRDGE